MQTATWLSTAMMKAVFFFSTGPHSSHKARGRTRTLAYAETEAVAEDGRCCMRCMRARCVITDHLAVGQLLGGWANCIPSRAPEKSQQSTPKLVPQLASLDRCPPTPLTHPPRGAGQRNSSRQQEQEKPKRKSQLGHETAHVYI
jgi:hypothetical protein